MKTALFVDFDNVYSGLRRISAQAAERFAKNPARWLRWLTDEMAGAINDAEPARPVERAAREPAPERAPREFDRPRRITQPPADPFFEKPYEPPAAGAV